jgi:hypothetical protein
MSFSANRFPAMPSCPGSSLRHQSLRHISRSYLALVPGRLRAGLTKETSQLKNTTNPSMMKPLAGLMLCNVVSANKLIGGYLNTRRKPVTRLSLPDSGVNLRHQQSYLREQRFLHLHQKPKTLTKRLQTTGKKFLHRITTADK